MDRKTLKQIWYEIAQKVLETKVIQVLVGKHKIPKDKDEAIIFHIDI